MKYYCYILYSYRLDKYYIGFTKDSLQNRLHKHLIGFYDNSFSKITDDWEVFFFITCDCASQALAIEKHIKNMKSKTYLIKQKNYPKIFEKLKMEYLCS